MNDYQKQQVFASDTNKGIYNSFMKSKIPTLIFCNGANVIGINKAGIKNLGYGYVELQEMQPEQLRRIFHPRNRDVFQKIDHKEKMNTQKVTLRSKAGNSIKCKLYFTKLLSEIDGTENHVLIMQWFDETDSRFDADLLQDFIYEVRVFKEDLDEDEIRDLEESISRITPEILNASLVPSNQDRINPHVRKLLTFIDITMIECNIAGLEMFGYSSNVLGNFKLIESISEDERFIAAINILKVIKRISEVNIYSFISNAGAIYKCEVRSSIRRDQYPYIIIGIARNKTKEHNECEVKFAECEAKIARLKEELEMTKEKAYRLDVLDSNLGKMVEQMTDHITQIHTASVRTNSAYISEDPNEVQMELNNLNNKIKSIATYMKEVEDDLKPNRKRYKYSGGHGKVLIVEDDLQLRGVAVDYLKTAGYTVFEAATAEEGITSYEEDRPDLVIMDLGLPKMRGEDAITIISSIDDSVPIIVATGGSIDNVDEKKIDGVINKPYWQNDFLFMVSKSIRK